MGFLKKYFALLMSVVLLFVTFVGCNKSEKATDAGSQAVSAVQENVTAKPLKLKRLQSVTIQDKDNGEIENYSVVWNGEECTFQYEDLEGIKAYLDAETNIFYFEVPRDYDDIPYYTLPLHQYDEQGKIVKFWNEDDISEECIVSYDENGLPSFEYPNPDDDFGRNEYEFDEQKRQVKVPSWGGSSRDDDGNVTTEKGYDIRTLNEYGDIISVDSLTITSYNGEKISEETEKDTKKYTYDENGNLIKYETKREIMTFTYTDETIHHVWERNLPIYYVGWYYIYDMPFFWNIK